MNRCESTYQMRDGKGERIGALVRCTREAGHPATEIYVWPMERHEWKRPGHSLKWPDSAAEKEVSE